MSPLSYCRALLVAGVFVAAGSPFLSSAFSAQNEDAAEVDATAFSALASALPFPPDAREVEFDASFGDIECKSGSPLGSLEDFYRREMKQRGWTEDETEATGDEESAKLTFEVGSARIVIDLDADSDGEVSVSMDTEGLDFDGTSDPAALLAAGIPQPRTYAFLQTEIPRPDEIQDVEYQSDECHFKSPIELQAAFDFYLKALKGLGWRESRKPIITGDRRYTEFRKGAVTVSVNIFSDEVGSRIILGYENPAKEKTGPPLPVVASSRPNKPGVDPDGDGDGDPVPETTTEKVAVDISTNKGSATVTQGEDKFVFKHVAAFQTKDGGDLTTTVVFCERPIPMQRLQAMLLKKDDFRFGDLFEFESPGQLTVDVGGYRGFSFNAGGVGIGDSLEETDSDMKVEAGRVRGAIKMAEPKEVFDESFLIAATVDVAVLTPNTTLGGVAEQPTVTARQSPFPDSELLLPEPGKGRLVMANAHSQNVVIMIGKKSYTLKAGQGAEDPKTALNYSVAPGKYDLTIKFPGKAPQTEKLEIGSGTTWGLFVLPTGKYLTNQMYGSAK